MQAANSYVHYNHHNNDEEMSSFANSSSYASNLSFGSSPSSFGSASSSFGSTSSSSSFGSTSSFGSSASFPSTSSGYSSAAPSSSPPASLPSSATSTPSRLRFWKNRDSVRESPISQMKSRRDEFVARFRGINLNTDIIDDDRAGEENDTWNWDSSVSTSWDLNTVEVIDDSPEKLPWYVLDDSLNWDQFLDAHDKARRAKGIELFHNETMYDPDGDNNCINQNPWVHKTELPVETLCSTADPNSFMCPACNHYSCVVKFNNIVCTSCHKYYQILANMNILQVKQAMMQYHQKHNQYCANPYAFYGIFKRDIALHCNHCKMFYNVSKNCASILNS